VDTNHNSGIAEVKSDQIVYTVTLYQVSAYGVQITLEMGMVRVKDHF